MAGGVGRGQGELELVGGDSLTGGRGHRLTTGMLNGGDRHRLIGGLGRAGGLGHLGRQSQLRLGGHGRFSAVLDDVLRGGVGRGLSRGGGVPGPARVVGGLRDGSRDGERVGTGLSVDLLAGL